MSLGLLLAASLAGCHPAPVEARSATLLYSASVDGDIEPCG